MVLGPLIKEFDLFLLLFHPSLSTSSTQNANKSLKIADLSLQGIVGILKGQHEGGRCLFTISWT